jgi:hypothetical protein
MYAHKKVSREKIGAKCILAQDEDVGAGNVERLRQIT